MSPLNFNKKEFYDKFVNPSLEKHKGKIPIHEQYFIRKKANEAYELFLDLYNKGLLKDGNALTNIDCELDFVMKTAEAHTLFFQFLTNYILSKKSEESSSKSIKLKIKEDIEYEMPLSEIVRNALLQYSIRCELIKNIISKVVNLKFIGIGELIKTLGKRKINYKLFGCIDSDLRNSVMHFDYLLINDGLEIEYNKMKISLSDLMGFLPPKDMIKQRIPVPRCFIASADRISYVLLLIIYYYKYLINKLP